MALPDFTLELFFAKHEFSARFLLCCSDAESSTMSEILALADDEAAGLWQNLTLGYTEAPGLPLLREEIAKQFYRDCSTPLCASHIHCFAGAEEGIYACMRALLNSGDHVVVVTPAYQSLVAIAAAAVHIGESGAIGVSLVDLEVQQGRWVLNIARLRASIHAGTKMVIVNFPHNPTGALLTAAEQLAVVELCREHGLFLFSDEVYRGLERDPSARLPPACTLYDKAFSLGVMSKSLGLAGLRIGWLASQDTDALQRIAGFKHYLSICNSAPSEILSLVRHVSCYTLHCHASCRIAWQIALRAQATLLARNNAVVAVNLRLVETFLAKWGEVFEWIAPAGGCVGFMQFKGFRGSHITLEQLAEALVTKHGCLILPGVHFPAQDAAAYRSYFRFGVGRRNFGECLAHLEMALQQERECCERLTAAALRNAESPWHRLVCNNTIAGGDCCGETYCADFSCDCRLHVCGCGMRFCGCCRSHYGCAGDGPYGVCTLCGGVPQETDTTMRGHHALDDDDGDEAEGLQAAADAEESTAP
jgi:aspartate/methionine/tyrosine aminotransferase